MEEVYLLLGSNKGDRAATLQQAIKSIASIASGRCAVSRLYESEPWGFDTSVWFLNVALKLNTMFSPEILLSKIMEIEKSLGRKRTQGSSGYESREIDIDIIFFGSRVIDTNELKIPHPRMEKRRFVLLPLMEIAPDFIHPVSGKTITELLNDCQDKSEVNDL